MNSDCEAKVNLTTVKKRSILCKDRLKVGLAIKLININKTQAHICTNSHQHIHVPTYNHTSQFCQPAVALDRTLKNNNFIHEILLEIVTLRNFCISLKSIIR